MNNRKFGRLNKTRVTRTYKLSPTTRAIRAALAISATVLALSGTGLAFAGTCASTAADTMSCNGDFTETVPGIIFAPTVDLTLILGDSTPTSVIPLAGDVGIDASWGGMVGITSYADIITDGADGIHQYGSTSATLNNYGSISTSVTAADANAVDISAYGDLTVVNGGDITATGSGAYDVTAVTAYSQHGSVRITNQATGTITATASDDDAVGVEAYVFGGYIRVYNDGEIAVSSVNGDATGIHAQASGETDADGNFRVGNMRIFSNGSIEATSDNGQAVGIYANALFGSALVAVTATGSVTAFGDDLATGISTSAGYNARVFNQGGSVSATANDLAIGIAVSGDRAGYVYNGGSITATSTYGDAIGMSASVLGTSVLRNVESGTIVVTGAESATGLESSADISLLYNDGAITVNATNGVAVGIAAHDVNYTKVFVNGSIDVNSSVGSAIGIDSSGATAYSFYAAVGGSTSVTGADAATGIQASASYYAQASLNGSLIVNAGIGDAIGIFAEVVGGLGTFASQVAVADIGTIAASSQYGNATGIWAVSNGSDSRVDNAGTVSATAVYGLATGIQVDTEGFTDASVLNSGSVDVSGYQAVGIGVDAYAGVGYVGNSGNITVDASAVLARATGIDAVSQRAVLVDNSGSIAVTVGLAEAVGIYALGTNDRATVINSGDINVQSNIDQVPYGDGYYYAGRDYATGIVARAEHDITVSNTGSITAESTFRAEGIQAFAYGMGGLLAVDNSGSIAVTGDFDARGIEAWNFFGDVTVDNAGSITVANSADSEIARYNFGIYAGTPYGATVTVVNSGSISVIGSDASWQYGIQATAHMNPYYGDSVVSVTNSGDINVSGSVEAKGIRANLYTGFGWVDSVGTLLVSNSGSMTVDGDEGSANVWGIYTATNNVNVDSLIYNSGSIAVSADLRPTGITHLFNDGGTSVINNSGEITATGHYGAEGVYARYVSFAPGGTIDHGDLSFVNSGSITASNNHAGHFDSPYPISSSRVLGVQLRISDIDVTAHNSGSITAISTTNPPSTGEFATSRVIGFGVVDYRGDGEIYVSNTGSITASLTSDGRKHGTFFTNSAGILLTGSYGAAEVVNSGLVSASAQIDATTVAGTVPRPVTVQGIRLENKQTGSFTSQGDRTVSNRATGIVTASGISNYGDVSIDASGIHAGHVYAADLVSADHGITIDNAGLVSASAVVGGVDNLGTATANGIFALTANGFYANGFIDVSNSGTVNASATAIAAATATGISARSGGSYASNVVSVSSSGIINTTATSTTTATAIGVLAAADDVTVALAAGSNIHATATGADGNAIGLSVSGDAITASNAGAINAQFIGEAGDTYGVLIAPTAGEAAFTNSGAITAIDADLAVGVQLNSLTATTLINSGNVTAASTSAGSIAVRTGASTDLITNTGGINGALLTGDGDDTLDNGVGGAWNAVGTSDFGTGDDKIINAGTIRLSDASIVLGSSSATGNSFSNSGQIIVSGDSMVDMGAGPTFALMSALNPLAFNNTGMIDFRDGAPDDKLTMSGDLDGDGAISVDVSALHGTSDLLYVNGSVADGSVNKINVRMVDLPTTASLKNISMVSVSGNSTAGAFVLGHVDYDPNQSFLTLDFNLLADIDATNASDDVFSLGVDATPSVGPDPDPDPDPFVNGLSDSGTLAAAIAPGAQSLMTHEVGTWRQRMGVIDKVTQGAVGLWARLFQNDGTVNPEHVAHNFGQGGNFAYDQKSSGTELGVDFAVTDAFSLGLLLGKSDATQQLIGSGVGSTKLDGDTRGLYATWFSPAGFYLDASYRQMDFDARVTTSGGQIRTDGKANAFNLEAGYAWTLAGGLKLEPQIQYTRIQVDNIDVLPGALADFQSDGGDSSRARLGVMVRKSFGASNTVWTPYASVNAVREFDGKNVYSINGDFNGETSIEGTSALVEGGLNVQTGNFSLFGSVNWQDGGALESFVGGQLGVRYAW